ncbi:CPBP family intramembrane glutamic endopeptidase [Microbacterium suwonense]|uniref:CPBP family intramembrane glutamic endopeptidase n=1 Tax=Microbacterium suwonense TaxID=683047 RepID=UPI003671AF69
MHHGRVASDRNDPSVPAAHHPWEVLAHQSNACENVDFEESAPLLVCDLEGVSATAAGGDVVATWLLAGLFIGFAEEVLTRGFVVNLLRKAGSGELVVAVVSSALFALLHSGNLLTGQSLLATGVQLVYTFAFGVCMYLAMRVTGTIIAPILLHASTDPSIFLQVQYPADASLGTFANLGNWAVILVGLIALFFIRGRVDPSPKLAV